MPVVFSNEADVSIFPVAKADGRTILAQAGVSRNVTLSITLEDLEASVLKSNAIEGRVSEVVVRGASGSEIGRYRGSEPVELSQDSKKLSADEIAARIAQVLVIPVAGMTWSEISPFLNSQPVVLGTSQSFSGELFSVRAGEFTTQRPLDQYKNLKLVFGSNDKAVKLAFREATRSSFGFVSSPRPFGDLDCMTSDLVDQCGILMFEKHDGVHVLVDVMTVSERAGLKYDSNAISGVFGDGTLAAMNVAETQVAYSASDLNGQGSQPVGAKVFWAGDMVREPLPLHDLRAGFSESVSADTMLWTINGQSDRTIFVTRSSLPAVSK